MADTATCKDKCPRCGADTVKGIVYERLGLAVTPIKRKPRDPVSGVDAYICSRCGQIELFAQRLDVFKRTDK